MNRSTRLTTTPVTLVAIFAGRAAIPSAAAPPIPNCDFKQGDRAPAAWQLTGNGRWVDRDVLEVSGTGQDSSFWRCDYPFEPTRLYRFRVRVRRVNGAGTAVTGPAFANRDQRRFSSEWQWVGHVFRVPDRISASYLRLGQWHATGSIQFDAVELRPVLPVHRRYGPIVLGEGESILNGQYTFAGTFSYEGSNFHRPLFWTNASFNSDRWVFSSGTRLVYRFALPGHTLNQAEVEAHVSYYSRGRCRLEVSRDGKSWKTLGERAGLGPISAPVPGVLLPASQLFIRVSSPDRPAGFQVNRIDFRAAVSRPAPDAVGETLFAELTRGGDRVAITSIDRVPDASTGRESLRVTVSNRTASTAPITVRIEDPLRPAPVQKLLPVAPDGTASVQLDLPSGPAGERTLRIQAAGPGGASAEVALTVRVPDFYRADYGERIANVHGPTVVWWCDATHKIPRQRAVPQATGAAARLEAARNDREAVQIVLRPHQTLRGLTATASDLIGPNGAVLPAKNVRIFWVYYHFVHHPTDGTGLRDWWPDALPPLDRPLDLPGGQNQPLWVLISVPADAVAGDYVGHIRLRAEGFSADVPLRLHVWDFTLPKRNHLETAYGLSVGDIFRYHGLKTEADKRKVLDLYFQSFAEHRISPYDPTPLDPIRVQFLPDANPPRAELDFRDFDRAMQRAVERYGFTSFRLPVRGMGGGTFHKRYPPRIGQYGEETPQYQAMFASYVGQLERHLREKGWLKMAYVYWFDEPAPRDYDFVAAGMRRLKKYAPGLRRMLTEEPNPKAAAAFGGLVDIWCPVSYNYDHEQAEKRRAFGEQFWWYVCTGPKAPYCTLFIDHPATELRVWHWQTWQRKIVGTLVWRANYWTSSAAYPDEPQNPYDDPMSYVSGYSTPRGVRRFWGNGDGRFLYPPLAAAVPGKSPKPVIAPPVSSIRWEMIREGVEDYEYLYLLRELIEKRQAKLSPAERRQYEQLLKVPKSITRDMTTFTTDPTPIYAHRRAVAEAIERLIGSGK